MRDLLNKALAPKVRRWAYRVAGSGLGVAGVYGVIDGTQSAALLIFCGALFGVADRNVNEG